MNNDDIKIGQRYERWEGSEPNAFIININGNGDYIYNGIDRINNNIGYTVENSVTCCNRCNLMKMKWTIDEFKNHIIKIYNYWAKENL